MKDNNQYNVTFIYNCMLTSSVFYNPYFAYFCQNVLDISALNVFCNRGIVSYTSNFHIDVTLPTKQSFSLIEDIENVP